MRRETPRAALLLYAVIAALACRARSARPFEGRASSAGVGAARPVPFLRDSDPSYDHQTSTYTSQLHPQKARSGASLLAAPFFSPDHSVGAAVGLVDAANASLDIYTPSFSSWSGCTSYDGCSGCTADAMRKEAFPVFAAVVNAARRGVRVRLITNDYGGQTCAGSVAPLDFLALQGGLQLRRYDSTTFVHTKYMCADDKFASVSSVNWSKTSYMYNREAGVLLQEVKSEGGSSGLVAFYQSAFETDWQLADGWPLGRAYSDAEKADLSSGGQLPVVVPQPDAPAGAYVTDAPVLREVSTSGALAWASPDFARSALLEQVTAATTSLRVMIYQVTDDGLCTALADANDRGVRVDLLVSEDIYGADDKTFAWACYDRLLDRGLTPRRTPSYYRYSHQKFWIVDGKGVGLSTGNWSPSDFPDQDTFPPYSGGGRGATEDGGFGGRTYGSQVQGDNNTWVKTNRDLNLYLEDAHTVGIFNAVIDEDWKRGEDWTKQSWSDV